ncbi:tail fiber domain-containing protein, partial [bacterium]|nr:tail fiber domain-containing protein [bacterium]
VFALLGVVLASGATPWTSKENILPASSANFYLDGSKTFVAIPADQFIPTEVRSLKSGFLANGSSPWTTKQNSLPASSANFYLDGTKTFVAIPADQLIQTEITALKSGFLASGASPWTTKEDALPAGSANFYLDGSKNFISIPADQLTISQVSALQTDTLASGATPWTGNLSVSSLTSSGDILANNNLISSALLTVNGASHSISEFNANSSTDQSQLKFQAATLTKGAIVFHHNATAINERLDFEVAAAPKLSILGNGNVGIGLITPIVKLDVNGNGQLSGSLNLGYTGGSIGGQALRIGDNSFYMNYGSGTVPDITFDSGDFWNFTRSSNTFRWAISGSERMLLDSTKMNVTGNGQFSGSLNIGYTGGTVGGPAIRLGDNFFHLNYLSGTEPTLSFDSGDLFKYSRSANTYKWVIGSADRMTLNGSGFLGIGTSTPSTILHVQSAVPNITVGNSSGALGAVHFGNANHGIKRNYASGPNDIGMYTTSGTLFLSASGVDQINRFQLNGSGNVGIGVSGAPAAKLQVFGDIRVGTTGSNGCVQNFAGTALTGTCSSDEKYKKEIYSLHNSLDRLNQLRPLSYKWRSNEFPKKRFGDEKNWGLIAQEVEKIFPEFVSIDSDGYKRVRYGVEFQMISIQAIKDLNKKVQVQETKLRSLERKLNFLMQNSMMD